MFIQLLDAWSHRTVSVRQRAVLNEKLNWGGKGEATRAIEIINALRDALDRDVNLNCRYFRWVIRFTESFVLMNEVSKAPVLVIDQ